MKIAQRTMQFLMKTAQWTVHFCQNFVMAVIITAVTKSNFSPKTPKPPKNIPKVSLSSLQKLKFP